MKVKTYAVLASTPSGLQRKRGDFLLLMIAAIAEHTSAMTAITLTVYNPLVVVNGLPTKCNFRDAMSISRTICILLRKLPPIISMSVLLVTVESVTMKYHE